MLEHLKPLSQLQEWQDNYNRNDVERIARSIRRFGFNSALRVWAGNVVMAGNHTLKALRLIKEQGPLDELDHHWPPQNVTVEGDEWYVQFVDVSHLDEMEARAYAIADNELARQSTRDEELLTQYLQEIAAHDVQMFSATGFDKESLDSLLKDIAERDSQTSAAEDETESSAKSDGSLLALSQITIAEPRHQVEYGDVWELDKHILVCAEVLTDWQRWHGFLRGDDLIFAPYPGPFAPLTVKAEKNRLVMVQPDPYIAGHILDRYADVKGANGVRKQD